MDDKSEVGYKNPPKYAQFKKGQSGNPKGRPKGQKNLATIVLKESNEIVRVNGPSGTRNVTKLHAAVMQLSNKAALGDRHASRDLIALVKSSEEAAASGVPLTAKDIDKAVMRSIVSRIKRSGPEKSTIDGKPREEK